MFCSVGAAIGLAIAWVDGASGSLTNFPGADELGLTVNRLLDILSTPAVALALAVAVGSLVATFWSDAWVRVWRY